MGFPAPASISIGPQPTSSPAVPRASLGTTASQSRPSFVPRVHRAGPGPVRGLASGAGAGAGAGVRLRSAIVQGAARRKPMVRISTAQSSVPGTRGTLGSRQGTMLYPVPSFSKPRSPRTAQFPCKSEYRSQPPCSTQSFQRSSFWGATAGGGAQTRKAGASLGGGALGTQARLFGPAMFEAHKLKVLYLGEGTTQQHPAQAPTPRMYTLTHSDVTAKITLAVAHHFNHSQFMSWYSRLFRDEVLAIWKHHCAGTSSDGAMSAVTEMGAAEVSAAGVSCTCTSVEVSANMDPRGDLDPLPLGSAGCHTALHVHCHISGGHWFLDTIAPLRFWIFRKELPVVLEAFLHGDRELFQTHPDLENAPVWVHFHSTNPRFNTHECWGNLRDAPQVGKQLSLGDIGGGSCSLFHKAFPEFAAREHQWPLI